LEPGWVKNQDPDPGSVMNIPDHISESLKTIFGGLKILKSVCADPDPGSGIFLTLNLVSRMEKFGSGINIPDPQHCLLHREKND
jgi:hypothetical protein